MKQACDKFTLDFLTASRGRPPKVNALTAAQRQAQRRERLRNSGKSSLTVILPVELIDGLDKFVQFKGLSKDVVIERLIRSQLLRKR
ncbi:hypothetical protein [Solimicrobium silvestre]|uniref:Replication regulatory protein RepB n=1 Tax=Solimicrobium silvestre TaxID=2099400 RepID=A0A2S9GTK2_9BURK|nr:hypothetical protein [Solimicrobium silvestre]PRC91031.1 Replication regulatory protein RepB [Solimicrobium silvestre]